MAQFQNRLEIRAQKLANAVNNRVQIVSDSLKPPGQRPAFTQLLSRSDALDWWLKNWSNPQTGGKVLANMDPMSRLELHNALSDHIEQNGLTQVRQMTDPMGLDQASKFPASQMPMPQDTATGTPPGGPSVSGGV